MIIILRFNKLYVVRIEAIYIKEEITHSFCQSHINLEYL